MEPMPSLFIFSGLPGTGKTTLARMLARDLKIPLVRVDTVEQALRDMYDRPVGGEGYRLSYRMVADNLRLGLSVVADSCNPLPLTRREWNRVAEENGARPVNVEIVCSDRREHRRRIEQRQTDIPRLALPTWKDVLDRDYRPWSDGEALVVDTAGKKRDEAYGDLLSVLRIF